MATEMWQAVILGIVQGIAEFLPISSSGHLVILGDLLHRFSGDTTPFSEPLELTIALHLGTLISIVIVYGRELRQIFVPRMMALVILATVPVGIVGLTLKDFFEETFKSPIAAGAALLVTGLLLLIGQKYERGTASLGSMTFAQAAYIGCWQAFALFPGVSRSGSTIAGGLLAGLDRRSATTFSFFIAIPAIAGGSVVIIKDLLEKQQPSADMLPLVVGAALACVVGIFSLKLLIGLVTSQKLHWFAYYCFAMGLLTVTMQLVLPAPKPEEPQKVSVVTARAHAPHMEGNATPR